MTTLEQSEPMPPLAVTGGAANIPDIPRHYVPSLQRISEAAEDDVTTASTSQPPATPEPPLSRGRISLLMLALCLSVFLAALDAVLITTALPTIARSVSASDAGFAWIGAAYLLASAAAVPLWGRASDLLGRRPLLILAQSFFMAGSLVSALAPGLAVLVAGRAVQGLGAGGVMALVNIVIGDTFSPRDRGLYFGMIGAAWGFASGVGPLLGGGLAQELSWRWCFWINLPVCGVSMAILVVFMQDSPALVHLLQRRGKGSLAAGLLAIDWLGAAVFAAATLMLLVGLEMGGVQYPWTSPVVLGLLCSGAVAYGLFAFTQVKMSRYPLMPPELFRDGPVVATYIATFFHGIAFSGLAFFLPIYFQTVLSASPVDSGIWLLATALPLAMCTLGSGMAIRLTGRCVEIIRAAMAVTVLAMGLFVDLPSHRDWKRLFLFQVVAALGIAPNLQALLIGLQALVRKGDLAAGTATFAFIRNVSIGIGVVIGQVILQAAMGERRSQVMEVGVPEHVAEKLTRGGMISIMGGGTEELHLTAAQLDIVRQCLRDSLAWLWVFHCGAAAVGLVSTLFIRQVDLSREIVEEKMSEPESSRTSSGRGEDNV